MHNFSFKRFNNSSINLFRSVTVLIGRNGAGKSNVIEGVDLLAVLANGIPLHEIRDIGQGFGKFEIRGGLQGCPRLGQHVFMLGFSAVIGENEFFDYAITIDPMNTSPIVCSEVLTVGNRQYFTAEIDYKKSLLDVKYDNFKQGTNPVITLSPDRSVLSRYAEFVLSEEEKGKTTKRLRAALSKVRGISVYLEASYVFDPDPKKMRSYERIGSANLLKDASNLSSVLHSLSVGGAENKKKLKEILQIIKQVPEESFDKFEFITTKLNDVILAFTEKESGLLLDARLLSDGTLRTLAVLVALHTVDRKSRVVIEEFDNGIHPSRAKMLVDEIWRISSERNLNVLMTTHNPTTLDLLSQQQLSSVVLCYYDQKDKSSKLIELLSIADSDILMETDQLGDLVTKGVLEKFVNKNNDNERKKSAKKWLDKLK